MRKTELKKIATETAIALEKASNPYKKRATLIESVDGKMYFFNGDFFTEEELTSDYVETATHDFIQGYNQRLVGYYDKWYRYCHADDGTAYDEGVKLATTDHKCKDSMNIIECLH